jgi:hypothetical protein
MDYFYVGSWTQYLSPAWGHGGGAAFVSNWISQRSDSEWLLLTTKFICTDENSDSGSRFPREARLECR